MEDSKHVSVLLQPAIIALNIQPGDSVVDVTLGGGGHSKEILKRLQRKGKLYAFDLDTKAILRFENYCLTNGFVKHDQVLQKDEVKVFLFNTNFINLKECLNSVKVNSIIADLGLSADEYATGGFSYTKNQFLDMRLDNSLKVTASDLLNGLYEKELISLFENLADIEFASKLAKLIIKQRNNSKITTTGQLRNIIQKIVPFKSRKGASQNPEAKVFQALRMAVNNEISSLKQFLPQAFEVLSSGGRIGVITFHSVEDRVVKNFFKSLVEDNTAKYIYKILKPEESEIQSNKKSRSAKLRVIKKIK